MAGWQHDKGEEDVESEDWNVAAKGKRGFEHPMASVAVSLFNSTILDKSGGEWTEPGGRGWNDNFMGQHPKERLLGIQLDSQAISTLLLPLKASDPILYRLRPHFLNCHDKNTTGYSTAFSCCGCFMYAGVCFAILFYLGNC